MKKNVKPYFFIAIAVLMLLMIGISVSAYEIASWFDKNQIIFHSPVEIGFFQPVKIQKRLAEKEVRYKLVVEQTTLADTPPSNTDKEKWAYITKQKYAPLLAYIWKAESNRGTDLNEKSLDNYCRSHGQFNEFGMGGMQYMKCYPTFADSVQAVITTLDSYGKMSNLAKLCEYNIGKPVESCDYVANWN